jgi:hypothetical protein
MVDQVDARDHQQADGLIVCFKFVIRDILAPLLALLRRRRLHLLTWQTAAEYAAERAAESARPHERQRPGGGLNAVRQTQSRQRRRGRGGCEPAVMYRGCLCSLLRGAVLRRRDGLGTR